MPTIKSNFDSLKEDFKKDTKLDANANMPLYINYVTARFADYNFQVSELIRQQLGQLPQEIAFKLGQIIKH